MTDAERLLADALRDRAEATDHPTTPLRDVVTAAHAIRRRRRRTAVLAVAAAVLAVTVPTAVVLGTRDAGSPEPLGPTPTAPTSSTSAAPLPSLAGLRQGPAPRIAHLEGSTFVSVDGSRSALPVALGDVATRRDLSAVTPYHGGYLLVAADPATGSARLFTIDGQGRLTRAGCTTGSPVLSQDQLETAWASFPCAGPGDRVTIHRGVASGMAEGEATQQVAGSARLAGILGQDLVYSAAADGAWLTDLVRPPRPVPGLAVADGVSSSGLVSGRDAAGDGVVVEPLSGAVRVSVPDSELGAFSPDGSLVVGTATGAPGQFRIVDVATGRVLSVFGWSGAPGSTVTAPVWEDDRHVLLGVTDGSGSAIVRADRDGRLSRAGELTPPGEPPVVLAVRP